MKYTLSILLLRNTAYWSTSCTKRLARVALFFSYLYLVAFLVLLTQEDRLLFAGASFRRPWREPPEYLHVREVTLPCDTGETIHAWFTTPAGWEPKHGAILYSHGAGSNLSHLTGRAHRLREPLGRAVMLYDYPGYGRSTGKPSEANCYASGAAAFRWLVEELTIPEGEVILMCESLGCAMAKELVTKHAARMLVLQGGFTSFPDMAQKHFPMFPGRFVVPNCMDNEAKIRDVLCPVFITHGTKDSVVPFAHDKRLYKAAREP